MPNQISDELRAQLFGQESDDPFLTLVTFSNEAFTARLVNNSKDITSRGNTFFAFPMKITLPVDDGETARNFNIDMDNASLEMIKNIRSITTPISVTIEMILASMPDVVQMAFDGLAVASISYNATKMTAKIVMDNFMTTEMTSERYTPNNFPGLF